MFIKRDTDGNLHESAGIYASFLSADDIYTDNLHAKSIDGVIEVGGLNLIVDGADYDSISNPDGESISFGVNVGGLCGKSTIIGVNAAAGNVGSGITAYGAGAAYGNSGISVTAIGIDAARDNDGWLITCIGANAGKDNTGVDADPQYLTVVGGNAGRLNKGTFATGMGGYVLFGNRGDEAAAFGWRGARNNLGDNIAVCGLRALENNDGDSNTAIGAWSFRAFSDGDPESFDYTDITIGPPSQITITGHSFGIPGTYVHLRYEEGTSAIIGSDGDLPGVNDGSQDDVYTFYIVDVDTVQFDTVELVSTGTGTGHKLYPRAADTVFINSIAIGYQSEPDSSNQCMIGDSNLTEIKSAGLLNLPNTGVNVFGGSVVVGNELDLEYALSVTGNSSFTGDADLTGVLTVDTVGEHTAGAGVTIDTVLIKDGEVDGIDVSTIPTTYFPLAGGTVTGATTFDLGVIINQSGADSDTRIEGSTNQQLFYVNAGDDRVGIGTISPQYMFSVASDDGSDQIGFYHDKSDAYFRTEDGAFIFQSAEGSNHETLVEIVGLGSGAGRLQVWDEGDDEYLLVTTLSGKGYICVEGTSPGILSIQDTAHADVSFFANAAEGEIPELNIYGYRTDDSRRSLKIGVGVDAADTASFDGVSNYLFDGDGEFGNLEAGDITATGTLDWSTESCTAYMYDGESSGTRAKEFWLEDTGSGVNICAVALDGVTTYKLAMTAV